MSGTVYISPDEFRKIVKDCVSELPTAFAEKLDNVNIVVEDLSNPGQCRRTGVSNPLYLLGLYEGVPKVKRSSSYQMVLPDKITVFRIPILGLSENRTDVKRLVRDTIQHEIGHHFGLSETEMSDL